MQQVEEWFNKADHDLEASRQVLADNPLSDIACFHAHQCVEKCLKGFLLARGQEIEKTRDLIVLLNACAHFEASFEQWQNTCFELTAYGVEVRYPNNPVGPSESDAREAVESATKVRGFVRSKLSMCSVR